MSSSLDSLSRNLVGVIGMVCEECGNKAKFTYIDGNYVAHETCEKCQGASHWKLEIDPIFNNLRVSHTNEQFQLLLEGSLYMDD